MTSEVIPSKLNPEIITLSPIKKGNRVLLHFLDLVIVFLFAMTIFSLASFPLGKGATGYDSKETRIAETQKEERNLLVSNCLLERENDSDSFDTALTYSSKQYALSFLKKEKQSEYFYHYIVEIEGKSKGEYVSFYQENAKDVDYFDYESEDVVLKEKYLTLFAPLLDSKDSFSSEGESAYTSFTSSFFPKVYSLMLEEIRSGEGVDSSLASISSLYKERNGLEEERTRVVSYCSILSYIIAGLIYFLLIPMISKRGKTLALMALRMERVGKDNLQFLKRRERPLIAVLSFFFSISLLFFVPMLYIDFASLFQLYPLLILSLLGCGLDLISFIVMCFDSLGRSLSDILTRSVLISKEDLEMLFDKKHFKVEK